MKGRIHSTESFGTVDGPGIRFVVFLQGCPLRCQYCHNPDTWDFLCGNEMDTDEILTQYKRNISFYEKGGITVTGGEPLAQIDFLIELFQKAKKENIHTCIDTSGAMYDEKNLNYIEKLEKLMAFTDLVMLDIKHIDTEKHKILTGVGNENILTFAKYLEKKNIPLWVRHVVVPTITDDKVYLEALGEFIGKLKNLKAIDVLPYHTLGVHKYAELGLSYSLTDIPSLSTTQAVTAKEYIFSGIKKAHLK